MSLDLKLCQKQWRQTWEHFGFKVGAIACWLMLLVNASSSLLKNTISDIYLFSQIGLNGVAIKYNIWWPTWLTLHYLHHLMICANFKQQKYLLIIQCRMLGFILHIDEYISIWLTFELSDIVAGLTCEFSCEAGKVVLQSPPCFFFTFNLKHWCGGQSGETLHHKFDQAACWSKHN